jgi:hypothetical protein
MFNKSSISAVNLSSVTQGAGGRGEALRFAAPLKGEQGVLNRLGSFKSAESEESDGSRPCRWHGRNSIQK